VCQNFGVSGLGSRRTEFLDIVSGEIMIERIPTKVKIGSALTCIGSRGFESAVLDHWTREVASSDSPISKEGDR
jgi:hypothetical protein